jgi:hypothetical protein
LHGEIYRNHVAVENDYCNGTVGILRGGMDNTLHLITMHTNSAGIGPDELAEMAEQVIQGRICHFIGDRINEDRSAIEVIVRVGLPLIAQDDAPFDIPLRAIIQIRDDIVCIRIERHKFTGVICTCSPVLTDRIIRIDIDASAV